MPLCQMWKQPLKTNSVYAMADTVETEPGLGLIVAIEIYAWMFTLSNSWSIKINMFNQEKKQILFEGILSKSHKINNCIKNIVSRNWV